MLDMLWSVGGFLVAISVLVAFHELGHYWVARRCGVKVLRFSVGFGRPLWRRTAADGVEWVIAAVPFGGYVKMLDEREAPVPPALRAQSFNVQPVSRRMAIVAAGPVFNFVLAAVFYWLVFIIGVQGMKPVIAEPAAESAAARAGLLAGEQIIAVDGKAIATWQVLRTELIARVLDGGRLPLQVRAPDGSERVLELPLEGVRVDPEFLFEDVGLAPFDPEIPPRLAAVVPGEPAEAAGFLPGDLLLARDGEPIRSWQQWAVWLRANPGAVVRVTLEREGRTEERTLIIARDEAGIGRFGARVEVPADLWQDLRAETRLSPLAALPQALAHTAQMSLLTVRMLWRMVLGDVSVKNVSGPIHVAQVAGYSAQVGLVSFLSFMAIVSVSIGVLNLLPVPLLDGGHLLYYGIEAVKGSPLSERIQEAGARVGLSLLMMLMGLAFFNDIMRLVQ